MSLSTAELKDRLKTAQNRFELLRLREDITTFMGSPQFQQLPKSDKNRVNGKRKLNGQGKQQGGAIMPEERHWEEGMKTHENIIFSCYGGLSNTGITSALACLESEGGPCFFVATA